MNDSRPDPDALLERLRHQDARALRGRLRVFLGMSAGVGKTYAMLEAGERALMEGVDAVIGVVETHGRFETAALVDSLKAIPRKKIEHRGVELEEMDLDAILARRPQLVLVDELAHSNAPGSRHSKRWQDVLELLDAGIDVDSTLNVQHLESRKEAVEKIQGVPVRETVPDSILTRADEIKLIDISPDGLLQRLAEGKVYPDDKAARAAENFFKPEALTALREIALRVTAERVDLDLGNLHRAKAGAPLWNTRERLMVAVDGSPGSESLLRAARRRAAALGAPWLAVHVSQGEGEQADEQLRQNLKLAKDLGAELVTTADADLAAGLARVARERNVTQLIVGRPSRSLLGALSRGGSLLNRLAREAGDFDLHVVRSVQGRRRRQSARFLNSRASFTDYWYVAWVVAGLGVLAWPVERLLGYRSVGLIFLAGLLGLSLAYSLGPLVLAAVLSAVAWNFFYIPPRFTWHISASEDFLLIVAFFLTALAGGVLTWRLRRSRAILEERESRTRLLYDLGAIIDAPGQSHPERFEKLARRLESALGLQVTLHLLDAQGNADPQGFGGDHPVLPPKEVAVADWAVRNRQPAGWSTPQLSQAGRLMIPLAGTQAPLGFLACKPTRLGLRSLSFEQEQLLHAASERLAASLERALLQRDARQAELLKESERLHQALLDGISHELRTPLTVLLGSAAALRGAEGNQREALLDEVAASGARLDRSVSNLLDLSRLNAGRLQLKKDWQDPAELLRLSLASLKPLLRQHPVQLEAPETLPLIQVDHRLFEHVLANLLLNAVKHSSVGKAVAVKAWVEDGQLRVRVTDQGPGIPAEALPKIFDRFYRAAGEQEGGTGLGLSIARAIVQAHGGELTAANREQGGAEFSLSLPIPAQPSVQERPT